MGANGAGCSLVLGSNLSGLCRHGGHWQMQSYCPLAAQGGLQRWRTLTSTANTLCSYMKAEETAETVISAARLCLGPACSAAQALQPAGRGPCSCRDNALSRPMADSGFLGDLAGEASDLLGVPACHWTDYKGFRAAESMLCGQLRVRRMPGVVFLTHQAKCPVIQFPQLCLLIGLSALLGQAVSIVLLEA